MRGLRHDVPRHAAAAAGPSTGQVRCGRCMTVFDGLGRSLRCPSRCPRRRRGSGSEVAGFELEPVEPAAATAAPQPAPVRVAETARGEKGLRPGAGAALARRRAVSRALAGAARPTVGGGGGTAGVRARGAGGLLLPLRPRRAVSRAEALSRAVVRRAALQGPAAAAPPTDRDRGVRPAGERPGAAGAHPADRDAAQPRRPRSRAIRRSTSCSPTPRSTRWRGASSCRRITSSAARTSRRACRPTRKSPIRLDLDTGDLNPAGFRLDLLPARPRSQPPGRQGQET